MFNNPGLLDSSCKNPEWSGSKHPHSRYKSRFTLLLGGAVHVAPCTDYAHLPQTDWAVAILEVTTCTIHPAGEVVLTP